MCYLLAVLMLSFTLFTLIPPPTVSAEDYSWTEDTSKQGLDGFYVCTGTATYGGNTGSITHNVGPDWNQPRASEMKWQQADCERITRQDVVNLFRYHFGQDIDPSIVKISGGFH